MRDRWFEFSTISESEDRDSIAIAVVESVVCQYIHLLYGERPPSLDGFQKRFRHVAERTIGLRVELYLNPDSHNRE